MTRVAFLFPGQGMETPGMGRWLARRSAFARRLLEMAGSAAGVDVYRVLRRHGPELRRTAVLQPILTAISLGVQGELRAAGIEPDLVAGHSLGELAAWAAAGGVDPEVAVQLAAVRGAAMERQAARHPGGMLALLAGDRAAATRACEAGQRGGRLLQLAAHNAPEEWVLSGERAALLRVAAQRPDARELAVAGPWHSAAMAPAAEVFADALLAVQRRSTGGRLVSSVTARRASDAEAPQLLVDQLTRPVRWAETLAALADEGVTHFVTIGPGRVLRGLLRKNLGSAIRVHATENDAALKRASAELRRACAA